MRGAEGAPDPEKSCISLRKLACFWKWPFGSGRDLVATVATPFGPLGPLGAPWGPLGAPGGPLGAPAKKFLDFPGKKPVFSGRFLHFFSL